MSLCVPSNSPSSLSLTKETARILIIGSGASGIAAATRLLSQGFKHVQLLEAEQRIGGRINTIPFADNVIDLGAQWCHGEKGNVVYDLVKDLNLLERSGDYYKNMLFVRSNKEIMTQETGNALQGILEKFATENIPEEYEGSMGDYLTPKFWQEAAEQLPTLDRVVAKEAFKIIQLMLCGWEGCDHLFEESSTNFFEDSEGDNSLNWQDKGYKTLLRVLMNGKEEPQDELGVLKDLVLINKRIVEINWAANDKLMLRCWNGEIFTADHVICTVSLGVLKEQHEKLFVPHLPIIKQRALNGHKLGTVDKFFLEFAAPPLPQDYVGFYFMWLKEDLVELHGTERFWLESISGFHGVAHQPKLLEGWITGEHARYMETLTEEKVLQGLQWLFRKFLKFELPQPKRFLRTQWHSNPNFRGSYSYRPTYADQLDTGPWDLEAPLLDVNGRPRLQFAGEATSRNHNSTVHGAIETGWREADRLNEYYQVRSSP